MTNKETPTAELACFHRRWKKNRDFLSGRDAVEKAGQTYLPKPTYDMPDEEYRGFLKNMLFFPAAIKVMNGWLGLVFKDKPDLIASNSQLESIKHIVTKDGDSLEDFSRAVIRETMTTNWTGILVDHPDRSNGIQLTAANAIENGFRPFLAMYPAESILEVRYGIVRNQRAFTYVRLLESDSVVHELSLQNGIYQIDTFTRADLGQWVLAKSVIPRRDGQPLSEIPFQIVSFSNSKLPTPSAFDHMVDLNCEIWTLTGQLMEGLRWTIHPIVTVTGVEQQTDKDGKPIQRSWHRGPGTVWELTGTDMTVNVHEFVGQNVNTINGIIRDKHSELARTGSRILADDKAVAEAAETIALRQESDNAILAGMVRHIAHFIQKSLEMMDWWLGGTAGGIRFELNTDYTVTELSDARTQIAIALQQGGYITDKEMFKFLQRPGGFIDPVVTYDEHQTQLESEVIDRPSTQSDGGAMA